MSRSAASSPSPGPPSDERLAAGLLTWYDAHHRPLPWRDDGDPYRVWVSEVMLQQTRVETVVPYYRRFVERFPDLGSLAAAPLDEVLTLWSGLGYYRRARLMHRAARVVMEGGGELPRSAAGLAELPGIGPYTAAAVASIAFGEAVPVLDGNVARLMARWTAEEGEPGRRAVDRRLRAAASRLLEAERPGDGNQALMELGATVCTPRRPDCPRCPLVAGCAARREGDPEAYPRSSRRRAPQRVPAVAVVVRRRGRLLLFRRGEDEELMPGLWEMPWVEGEAAARPAEALARRYGGRFELGAPAGRTRHGVTFRDYRVEVRRGAWLAGEGGEERAAAAESVAEGPEAGWFAPAEIAGIPTSSLVGKVLAVGGEAEN